MFSWNSAEQLRLVFLRGRDSHRSAIREERGRAAVKSDAKWKSGGTQREADRNLRARVVQGERKRRGATSSRLEGQSLHEEDQHEAALTLLNAQKQEAEASNNDQEPKFEILAAVKESVPRPDALGERHRESLNGHEEEEDAAETHGGTRNSK